MEQSAEEVAAANTPPPGETGTVAELTKLPTEEAVAASVPEQPTEKVVAVPTPPPSDTGSVETPVERSIEEAVTVSPEPSSKTGSVVLPVEQPAEEAEAASTSPSGEAESAAGPTKQPTEEAVAAPSEPPKEDTVADPTPPSDEAESAAEPTKPLTEEAVAAPSEPQKEDTAVDPTLPSSETESASGPTKQPTEEAVAAPSEPPKEDTVADPTSPSSETESTSGPTKQPTEEAMAASGEPPKEDAVADPRPLSSEAESVAALMAQVHSIVQSNTFKAFQAIMTAHDRDVEEERKVTTQARDEAEAVKAELEKSREELSALRTEFDSKHTELEKLAHKMKDLESEAENLRKETGSKDEALAAAAAEVLQLRAQTEEADTARAAAVAELAEARKDLAASHQEIELKGSRFQGLENFLFPLVEASREDITQHLRRLFLDAHGLVDTFFNDDFDGPTLANKTTWGHFLKHKVAGQLPLPRSNSAAAKQMRVAAVLAVLADALTARLFQPTYLLEDSNEVAELLDALLLEDEDDDEDDDEGVGGGAAQERHLRASLLRFDAAQQDANAQARESRVAHEVLGLAGRLLPLARQADFARRLALLCRRARDAWKWVQRLGPRVEPALEPEDADAWLLLPAAAAPGDSPRAAAAAAPDDIKLIVWPGFLIQGPDDAELVCEGFVVDKRQAQAAADEEQAQRGHRKGSRPGARPGAAATNGNGVLLHKPVSSSEPEELSDDD